MKTSWDNNMYVRVSQDSTDTLTKGSPITKNPGIFLCMSEYPRIPWILWRGGPQSPRILGYSCVCQSIPGFCRYFDKGVPCHIYLTTESPDIDNPGITLCTEYHRYFAKEFAFWDNPMHVTVFHSVYTLLRWTQNDWDSTKVHYNGRIPG